MNAPLHTESQADFHKNFQADFHTEHRTTSHVLAYSVVTGMTAPPMPVLVTPHSTASALRAFPKIDLHRHLEGAIRLSTVAAIAGQYRLDLPTDERLLKPLIQCVPSTPRTITHFFSKFEVLRKIYCSEEVIRQVTRECIEDASQDGVRHLELRFSPRALARLMAFPFGEVIDWVGQATTAAREQSGISVALIICINRHESRNDAAQILKATLPRLRFGITAVDLAGREQGFPAAPFAPVFAQAREAGLDVMIHAGEWVGADNVREAIAIHGCTRIGHGVRVLEDPAVVDLARERGVTFEVCPTSNYLSGAIKSIEAHPLRAMIAAGLQTTLNTDDPAICGVTLSDEWVVALNQLQLAPTDLHNLSLNALDAAYLPTDTREQLRETLMNAQVSG